MGKPFTANIDSIRSVQVVPLPGVFRHFYDAGGAGEQSGRHETQFGPH